jgi:phosphopantothenate synthetase
MSTLGEDLKAARAKLLQARQGAAAAVAESGNVASLVIEEISKLEKETEEMRAEIAGMNGGPA